MPFYKIVYLKTNEIDEHQDIYVASKLQCKTKKANVLAKHVLADRVHLGQRGNSFI